MSHDARAREANVMVDRPTGKRIRTTIESLTSTRRTTAVSAATWVALAALVTLVACLITPMRGIGAVLFFVVSSFGPLAVVWLLWIRGNHHRSTPEYYDSPNQNTSSDSGPGGFTSEIDRDAGELTERIEQQPMKRRAHGRTDNSPSVSRSAGIDDQRRTPEQPRLTVRRRVPLRQDTQTSWSEPTDIPPNAFPRAVDHSDKPKSPTRDKPRGHFCVQCGSPLPVDQPYCGYCGTRAGHDPDRGNKAIVEQPVEQLPRVEHDQRNAPTRSSALARVFGKTTERKDSEEATTGRIMKFSDGRSGAMIFDADTATDTGPREENQDWAILSTALLGIADGVGGRSAGGEASKAALRSVRDAIEVEGKSLASAVSRANREVRSRQDEDAIDRGRATTLDVVHLDQTGNLYGAHVGDSRVYVLPARGRRMRRMTADHASGNKLTRSIGGSQSVAPDVWSHEAEPGDLVLVATDGLWKGSLDERTIEALLVDGRGTSTYLLATRLVDAARDGARDNVTVIVGRVVPA